MPKIDFANIDKKIIEGFENPNTPLKVPMNERTENELVFLYQENKRVVKGHILSLQLDHLTDSDRASINKRIDVLNDENTKIFEENAELFI